MIPDRVREGVRHSQLREGGVCVDLACLLAGLRFRTVATGLERGRDCRRKRSRLAERVVATDSKRGHERTFAAP